MGLTRAEYARMAALVEEIKVLNAKAAEPDIPTAPSSGAVVKFTHQFYPGGKRYWFAARRGQGTLWYLTHDGINGMTKYGPMSWKALFEFADEGTMLVANDWEAIG